MNNHYYWLPPQGTLDVSQWMDVIRSLKKAHRQGELISASVWSLLNLISVALQALQNGASSSESGAESHTEEEEGKAVKGRRVRNSMRAKALALSILCLLALQSHCS